MSALRKVSRFAVMRGLSVGSRRWLAIGVAASVLRVMGKVVANQPELVYSEQLQPGQTLIIRHFRRDEN